MFASIIIIGYSGHASVAVDAIVSAGGGVVGYCDVEEKENNLFNIPYLGTEQSQEAQRYLKKFTYLNCIGDIRIRMRLADWFDAHGIEESNAIVHRNAYVGSFTKLGKGVLIGVNAIINTYASVGRGGIINSRALVEHDCVISDFVHVAPGAILLGGVRVGLGTFVGAGAVVLPGVMIGERCTIGAGAVVTKNVADQTTVVGNPARPLR